MTTTPHPDASGVARAVALALAFVLVLLVWALALGVLYVSTEMADAGDGNDVGSIGFCILLVAISSTFWLANLINKTLTGEDVW